jgi:hypothetical protein
MIFASHGRQAEPKVGGSATPVPRVIRDCVGRSVYIAERRGHRGTVRW